MIDLIKLSNDSEPYYYNLDTLRTSVRSGTYVRFGDDNLLPQHILKLLEKSSTHLACIETKIQYAQGNAIINNSDIISNEDIEKIVYDYIIFGGFALQVVKNKRGTKINKIYHIDFTKIRSGYMNEEDSVTEYFYNPNWERSTSYEIIPAYDGKEPNSIFYYKPYRAGVDYYPYPSYLPAARYIELEELLATYYNATLKNGASPSLIAVFPGVNDPEVIAAIQSEFKKNFQGANNAGKVIKLFTGSNDQVPTFTPVELKSNDKLYQELVDIVNEKIIQANRISSKTIVGLDKSMGLSSNADEIAMSDNIFQTRVINPIQKDIVNSLAKFGINIQFEQFKTL
jgi:hypothetical protein